MYYLARHINDISLNNFEYALDDNLKPIKFKTIRQAKNFCFKNCYTQTDFDNNTILIVNDKREIVS